MGHRGCNEVNCAVSFYVQKSLAHGPIRFGVSPRLTPEEIDSEAGLSTGPTGEFLRKRTHGFFFADTRPIGLPAFSTPPSIARQPFLQTMRGEGARGIGFLALMAVGFFFMLLGIAVVARKGPQGWIPFILGAGMVAAPVIITAQKRRAIRIKEDQERAIHEEREKRHRAMLEGYAAALEKLRKDPSEANLAAVQRERQTLEVPYKVWSQLAKRSVLQIGFDALTNLTPARSAEIAQRMSRAADAVGLQREDERETKLALYAAATWHLLADDRLGTTQAEELRQLREGLGIAEADAPDEAQAIEEFRKLQGITRSNVPRAQCGVRLRFREYCIHTTRVTLLSDKGVARGTGSLTVTNKRVVVDAKKKMDIELMQIDDVEVDADLSLLTIKAAKPARPVTLKVEQPIYTAALIDLATTIDERPKGFA